MNNDDIYDAWKARRADVPVPDGFAGQVMAAIPATKQRASGARGLPGLAGSPLGRAAVILIALAACLFRMFSAVAPLID